MALLMLVYSTTTSGTEFKTQLQLAEIKTMNQIASTGLAGLMEPVEPGLSCVTQLIQVFFGYDPYTFYRGREAFEIMGSEIDMQTRVIVLNAICLYREFPEWGLALIDALNQRLPFKYKQMMLQNITLDQKQFQMIILVNWQMKSQAPIHSRQSTIEICQNKDIKRKSNQDCRNYQ
ncbi:unnamed protein product (macronuclear) [Paramecium tetraurelia]|uniref:Uncharacterized protein n=1 Tax=Paramecium tetraurelia TaxID=5888 RepID=A0DSU5_PARTE|nr:uncharacterized protein GSPATT00019805001 [Paramecium tetraurelia]CAK86112.1 unnamed protein product [Paramecium tetraurelia]|eukprot:XP_001453509.1 hypothetical protein (macronuclear) [Paramecium tetraurelia strain d4-2]